MRTDDLTAAHRAHRPDEISDNVPEEHLKELMYGFYSTKVVVTEDKAKRLS